MKLASSSRRCARGDCGETIGAGEGRNERRGTTRAREDGLMRIESWGRFSVYVACIWNFGAPNHIQYPGLRLSAHVRNTDERTGRIGARLEEKNGYVFSICNFAARDLGGAYAMYQTGKFPKGTYPQKALKIQIQTVGQRTVKIIRTLSRSV